MSQSKENKNLRKKLHNLTNRVSTSTNIHHVSQHGDSSSDDESTVTLSVDRDIDFYQEEGQRKIAQSFPMNSKDQPRCNC